ncbi:DUF317 domain-containing protein [Streptomyces sp. NBC_00102]|uniref:DUF317 domain-containing protein n=1 Tax=Streptomyces sp. NBC_00102 TaxID=2975652 RepID=UPI00224E5493|nr:DUF317 domain-containing protein [Streptomyces sp. NBC_00102]MCX5395643.1 DUF317 domain-containing protein [Streptomyces sp. NBC_00102]
MRKKQWQGWGSGEQAEQHYLVQPRALAGGGDFRYVSEFLRASGWRDRSKTGGPLHMESPDRAVRVTFAPHVRPGGWAVHGRTGGAPGEWSAYLGPQTPVEIVAGLTDALTRPRSAHAPTVWAPLQEQNWHTRFEGRDYIATSPDTTTWMQYRYSHEGEAMWRAGVQTQQSDGWAASFTPNTPIHLVQAFSTELASPDPVMRPRGSVPVSPQIRTWSVSVTPSELGAWQQARITAARAATWARNSPRTALPHAPAGGARTRR